MAEHAPPPDLKLEMASEPTLLSAVRAMICQVAGRTGFSERECSQITLAVDEALCNIINHGYGRRADGRIWLSLWHINDNPGIRIVLEDLGRQVEPDSIRSRDLDDIRPGGLGVHIIKQIMDQVKYEKRDGGGMRLTMIKRLARSSANETSARASDPVHQCHHEGSTHERQ